MPPAPSRSTSTLTSLVVATCLLVAIWLVLSGRGIPATADAGTGPPLPVSGWSTAAGLESAIALAPSAAPSAPAPPAARPQRAYRIAAIGDSLTDSKSHGGKYLAYLASKCPHSQIDNYGKGADMVNQMRRRFSSTVLAPSPDPNGPTPRYTHVIIFGGVNDLYSDRTAGRTPPKISKDLLWMYTQAHEQGMQVVALTVAPWGGFRKYYNYRRGQNTIKLNRWIKGQFDAGTADYVVDAYALLSCGRPEYLCPDYAKPFRDGIHFGPAGHEKLGQAIHEQVFSDCR